MGNITTCPNCGAKNRLDPQARSAPVCGRCRTPLLPAAPVTVTDGTFPQMLAESRVPILLDLWAPWCGPCRMLAPTLDQLASEYAGRVVFAKVNIDENSETAGRYRVDSIPTLILFKDGKVLQKLVGVQPRQTIQQALRVAM
jgi:thioredoxin 2